MENFTPKIKNVVVEPKVYGVLLKGMGTNMLNVTVAHSLDQALANSYASVERMYGIKKEHLTMSLQIALPLSALLQQVNVPDIKMPIPKKKTADDLLRDAMDSRNALMKAVIETKNKALFDDAKRDVLRPTEVKFIEAEWKKLSTKS